ncbi:hypothetical protein [Demequina lutea]|uniref:DUF4430 domain-containing protein n=1 Tax=Demequina lutea TaxID=431489 RepID=A0A7Y9ZBH5_9MICO|nr:hypothetical protein [Demequina lutea]NYI41035.1 hypothetical protein [Demequina lutea]
MLHPRIVQARPAAFASSVLFLTALLVIALPTAPASASEGACRDGSGVTVVVDATDIGGSIVIKCAAGEQATGRSALEAAGFVATDSQPGMICAIDAQPDPCPTTFDGSYWSYWHGSPGGDWISYQVGADSSHPVPGDIEGWRYNDGSTGPGIALADVAAPVATQASVPSATATPTPSAADTPTATAKAAGDNSASTASATGDRLVLLTTIGVAALIAALVVLFLLRSRNRRASEED